eukprot:CAMPEP_0185211798 /NCGR_PEP_ID=MMETSP1140-20130426/67203_1 /TAXON_ID=298111 /ORGANISM="Pavlova sp., Strain CCMP459" /LENGTH=143 /DNA_ID=CAMNT_0027779641 /DNA_START=151 /DNA_END=583 /DNA_ORIENTATION=-
MDMAFSNGTQQTHGIINVCSTLEYTGNSVVCPISGAVDSHCHMSLGFIQCALQHHNAHTLEARDSRMSPSTTFSRRTTHCMSLSSTLPVGSLDLATLGLEAPGVLWCDSLLKRIEGDVLIDLLLARCGSLWPLWTCPRLYEGE